MAQVRKYKGGTGEGGIKKPEEQTVMKTDTDGNLTDEIEEAVVTAKAPTVTSKTGPKGSRYFIDNVEQDRDEFLKYLHNTLQTDLWSVIDSDKNNNHDYHFAKGSNSFTVTNRDDDSDVTNKLFSNITATPADSNAKRN